MYTYQEPYSIKDITAVSSLADTASDIPIKGKKFILQNSGAQPMYFKEKNGVACTASNGMVLLANTIFPFILTADTLSVISNATTTSYRIMYIDI